MGIPFNNVNSELHASTNMQHRHIKVAGRKNNALDICLVDQNMHPEVLLPKMFKTTMSFFFNDAILMVTDNTYIALRTITVNSLWFCCCCYSLF